jgi:Bacteriocin-protection, YdeI or OmpD-Associated
MKIPADLQAAIDAEPKAKAMLAKLSEQNRFALAFRTHNMKTEAGRKKKIETFVAMLKRGETIYPQSKNELRSEEYAAVEYSQKVRDDHLGLFSVAAVALAKRSAEQCFLRSGAPREGRDNPAQHDEESRPTAEGDRLADGQQCEAKVDGVAYEAIGTGCYEARALIRHGHEAPCGTKLGPGSEDEAGARDRQK